MTANRIIWLANQAKKYHKCVKPPTLAECCIWGLQKMNSWVDENGGRSGGLSPTEVKDLLKKTFQNSQSLRKIIPILSDD